MVNTKQIELVATPAISVVIPAFNVASFIGETLDSVLAQTRRDFEVIVVNDGSTDNTREKVASYRASIIYIEQKNSGVMRARNAGIEAARGRLIAVVDGDDLWEPRFLEVLAGMLDADPQMGAAFPNAWFFGSPRFAGRLFQDVFPTAEPVTFDRVLRRECYIFGSLVFRRAILDDVGFYDEGLKGQGAEDLELWLRMLYHGYQFNFSRDPLVHYRWRRDSLSNSGVGLLKCVVSTYEKLLDKYELTVGQREWVGSHLLEMRAHLDFALFKETVANGNYADASRHLADANRFYRRPKFTAAQILMKFAPGLVARAAK